MEIRLAGRSVSTITEKANSREQGMVSAAISEIGTSPRKMIKIRVTKTRPRITT
jgi:hypothetical protein